MNHDAKTPIVTLILPPRHSIKVKAWVGFTAMTIGMFMAILDIQIVASSLPDIQAGLGIAQSVELGADRVSDSRGRRDPADRLVDPRHVHAWCLSRLHLRLYRCEPGLRRVQQFLVADPGAGAARLLRRLSDPAGFLGHFSDVRGARA